MNFYSKYYPKMSKHTIVSVLNFIMKTTRHIDKQNND